MHITGIISEYNPFHNGHKYLIESHRKRHSPDGVIAVMSGSFTQRGEAAILDKWTRAAIAVQNGADLVLELPFCFAVRSAEHFARGGTSLLQRLGIVDTLCFGSECADAALLQRAARIQKTPQFGELLQSELKNGASYAAAACTALSRLSGIDEAVLRSPNMILGMEYMKSSLDAAKDSFIFNFDIVERRAAGHNDETLHGSFASGTAIRKTVKQGSLDALANTVPAQTFEELKKLHRENLPSIDVLFLPLLKELRLARPEQLSTVYGVKEGLENRLIECARTARTMGELLDDVKSRRYPYTALQRLLLYILLDISAEQMNIFDRCGPLYARVLAFNSRGRELLSKIKKNAAVPLITKTAAHLNSRSRRDNLSYAEKMLALDIAATELYALCRAVPAPFGADFTTSPLYLKI